VNFRLRTIIDAATDPWGVTVVAVEVKDVQLVRVCLRVRVCLCLCACV